MSLSSSVSLLVASLDLKLVQLIRGAMAVADITGAMTAPGQIAGPAATFEQRRHIHPEPVYERRLHVHPEPRLDTGPVLAPAERFDNATCACPTTEVLPVAPPCSKSPIEPPWKVLPWENPLPPRPKVKLILHRTDTPPRGAFVNVFA